MEDKYTFETIDRREMDLVVNRNKMLLALSELKDWYGALYNGKCYDTKYVCEGKIYTQQELHNADNLQRDEHGLIKDCKEVYLIDDVLNRINDIIGDMYEFIERNMY